MLSVDFSTCDQEAQLSLEPVEVEAGSIYKIFEKIKDKRKDKGKRYPLALILTLITLAKMAGETKIEGIVDWIDLRKKDLKKLLNQSSRENNAGVVFLSKIWYIFYIKVLFSTEVL
jgi:hypothetical protein